MVCQFLSRYMRLLICRLFLDNFWEDLHFQVFIKGICIFYLLNDCINNYQNVNVFTSKNAVIKSSKVAFYKKPVLKAE